VKPFVATLSSAPGSSLERRIIAFTGRIQLTTMWRAAAVAVGMFSLLMPLCSSAQNIINTYAGGGPVAGTAFSVDLPGPTSAIRDAAGNIYIAAPYSTYVLKLSAGSVSAFAGSGIEGFSGDGGPASKSTLALPNGLTIDSKGTIYIADFGVSRVRKVDSSGNITTVAGNGVKCEPSTGTCGDGGPATSAAFNFPMSVAVDSAFNVYIADAFDNRIRAINVGTTTTTLFGVSIQPGNIATIAGNGTPCSSQTGTCGDGGPALGPTLDYPESLAFDSSGNLYIADTHDNKIRMITPAGVISTVAGNGATCNATSTCGDGGQATAANLHLPGWIFLDASNNIYVADTLDNKIRLVNATTHLISTVAGNGVAGFNGDGTALSTELNLPSSVFLDGSGNLLIADSGNQRVRQLSAGNISTLAGGGSGGDGGVALNATFANPFNVAEDAAGNLYIADTANNRIRMVNAQTLVVSTAAGSGVAGYTGDGGLATLATLTGPTGVLIDSAGNVWIADAGNLVVRKVDGVTHNISTYAGTGRACYPTTAICGDNGPATGATFSTPLSLALDTAGNLLIADYTAHRIREVNATTKVITTVAGDGNLGKRGDGGPATQAHLSHPSSVVVDSSNNFYIDDSYNNEIRQVKSGIINLWALSGAFTLSGDGGPAIDASQWNPMELAIDPSNNVFIGGGNNNCVRRVDVATAVPTIGTVAGDVGQHCLGGYAGDGGLATVARISNVGLTVDGGGNLYIADTGNNRIRSLHLTPAIKITNPPVSFGALPIGTASTPQTLSITSSGGVDLSLSNLSFGGNFPAAYSQTNTCGSLPNQLGVDVRCSISVTFTPTNYGQQNATLVLTDNGPNSPQTVSLSGSGPYFKTSAAPATLTISPGALGNSTLTVTPFGQFNQTVKLSCASLPPASTYTITPSSVTPDGTDPVNASLAIQTNTGTTPGTYNVVCTGKYGAQNQVQWSTKITVTIP